MVTSSSPLHSLQGSYTFAGTFGLRNFDCAGLCSALRGQWKRPLHASPQNGPPPVSQFSSLSSPPGAVGTRPRRRPGSCFATPFCWTLNGLPRLQFAWFWCYVCASPITSKRMVNGKQVAIYDCPSAMVLISPQAFLFHPTLANSVGQ